MAMDPDDAVVRHEATTPLVSGVVAGNIVLRQTLDPDQVDGMSPLQSRSANLGVSVRAFKRPEFLPIAEAASRLGCSVRTLQRLARDGRISFVRRGRCAFVLREDLARLEVGGRTDWLVNRLADSAAESMRVAEWFRHWIELQRLLPDSSERQFEWNATAAEHVIERDGERSMAEYGIGDLATALDSCDLPSEAALGLRILSRWPTSERRLVDAYREALRTLLGWQLSPEARNVREGRSESLHIDERDDGQVA